MRNRALKTIASQIEGVSALFKLVCELEILLPAILVDQLFIQQADLRHT